MKILKTGLNLLKKTLRKPTNKTWVPNNNHHSIELFIEATRNEINNKIETRKQPHYSNLSVKEQKELELELEQELEKIL